MSYNVLTRTAGQGYGGAVRRMLAGGKGDSGNTQNPQEKDNANALSLAPGPWGMQNQGGAEGRE